jgi:carboxymethylenebutenolidase
MVKSTPTRGVSMSFGCVAVAAAIVLMGGLGPARADKPESPSSATKAPEPRTVEVKPEKTPMGWTGILSEESFKVLHELKKGAAPEILGETIELAGGEAYLSLPEGKGPHPGIVVIQEWWGLNENIKFWSDRLAAEGYAAVAVDLYDGKVATNRDDAYAYMQSVEDGRAHEILRAALDFLKSDPRIRAPKRGSIGWCFGGGWSLNLALAAPDLDAAVVYYGRLVEDPEELGKIGARICGIFGNQDQGIPPESVDGFVAGLEKAGVDHEIHRYDANHAFANPSSARYDHEAAAAAWEKVREFLAANLRSSE